MRSGIIARKEARDFEFRIGVGSSQGISWREDSDLSGCEAVFLVFRPERAVVLDMELPVALKGKMLENALFLELENRLPVSAGNIRWAYRKNGKSYRVFAVHEEEFRAELDALREAGLKCDAVLVLLVLVASGRSNRSFPQVKRMAFEHEAASGAAAAPKGIDYERIAGQNMFHPERGKKAEAEAEKPAAAKANPQATVKFELKGIFGYAYTIQVDTRSPDTPGVRLHVTLRPDPTAQKFEFYEHFSH